jgi:hypothetical protein
MTIVTANDDLKSELVKQSSAGVTEGNYFGTVVDPSYSNFKDFGATIEQLMVRRKLEPVPKKSHHVKFQVPREKIEASNQTFDESNFDPKSTLGGSFMPFLKPVQQQEIKI